MVFSELRQRGAQARAACKVGHQSIGAGQHGVGVGQLEGGGQVGQVHAKSEHLALAVLEGGGMQKSQQQAGIALHGARHIDQHHQRQRLAPAGQPGQLHELAAAAGSALHDAGPVRPAAALAGLQAARRHFRQLQGNLAGQPLHQAIFVGRQGVEVGMPQAL